MPLELTEAQALDYLMPLQFFCGDAGLPPIEFLAPDEMPELERSLLDHENDMTSTLRNHHGDDIDLEVHRSEGSEDYVMRAVVLITRQELLPVEFGAIGIQLESFPPPAADDVRGGQVPLGAIIEKHGIRFTSHPRAFFRIQIDEVLAELLDREPGGLHYGRCNELRDPDGIVFADIVEILP